MYRLWASRSATCGEVKSGYIRYQVFGVRVDRNVKDGRVRGLGRDKEHMIGMFYDIMINSSFHN